MNIVKNILLERETPSGNKRIERILFIDPQRVYVHKIDLYGSKALPEKELIADLKNELKTGKVLVLENDPFTSKLLLEEPIAGNGRVSQESVKRAKSITVRKAQRDAAYEIIKPIIQDERQYNKKERALLIKEVLEEAVRNCKPGEKPITKKTIYKYLKRWWQRGQVINCLLGDYSNCGGFGKERKIGSIKLGRPKKYISPTTGAVGVNVDEATREIIRKYLPAYVKECKETEPIDKRPVFTLKGAREYIIKHGFHKGKQQHGNISVKTIPHASKVFSYRQLVYHYHKIYSAAQQIEHREGNNEKELNHRGLPGSSTSLVTGIGQQYQIDSTETIELVSEIDRKNIGRAFLYLVVDVYSWLIVGVCVVIYPPSRQSKFD
ncbi:MAG: hypothetical protein BGO39_03590 [Chloroflexi bacterium 54-19]|nr:MAG: hypothetical protein BGO39_03590 [Chloroflexi bacterium 54-19]